MSDSAFQHIIKQQHYDIGMNDATKAHAVQSRISFLQDTRIQEVIHGVLDRFSEVDCVYQFDQVALDLGAISLHNYEEELGLRLEEALIEYFSAAIGEHGYLRVGRKLVKQGKLLDQLTFFLESGHFPWNTVESKSASQMLELLIKQQPQDIRERLIGLGMKEKIRKRMIYQFDESLLDQIVLLVAKTDSSYILEHKDHMLQQHQQQPLVEATPAEFNQVVWEIILGYLFVASNGYFSKKSYLTYLLKKTASAYNISYIRLLDSLVVAVAESSAFTEDQSQFKKIIRELSLEAHSADSTKRAAEDIVPSSLDGLLWKQLTQIIIQGYIPATWPLKHRAQWNDQLQRLIQSTPETEIAKHFDSWVSNAMVRRRILQWFQPELLERLIRISSQADIQLKQSFLDTLIQQYRLQPAQDATVRELLVSHRMSWVFSGQSSKNTPAAEVITELLENMLKTFANQPESFFRILKTANAGPGLPETAAVTAFLRDFYRQTGGAILHEILIEFNGFVQANDARLWKPWWANRLTKWMEKTRLSKPQLMQLMQQRAAALNLPLLSAPNFWKQLELPLRSGIPVRLDTTVIKEGRQSKENQTSVQLQALLVHVWKTGGFPWWQVGYSWEQFNEDLRQLLQQLPSTKAWIDILRQSPMHPQSLQMLDTDNFVKMCHGTAAVPPIFEEMMDVHHYLSGLTEGIPVAWDRQFVQWRQQWWTSLALGGNSISSKKNELLMISLFEEDADFWETLLERFHLPKIKAIWLRAQPDTQAAVPSEKEQLLLTSSGLVLDEVLSSLLKDRRAAPTTPTTLYERAEALGKEQPALLKRLLKNKHLRQQLIRQLQRPQLIALMEGQLHPRQKAFFVTTLSWLERFRVLVSFHEYRQLNHIFADMMLTRFSHTPSISWGMAAWARLLYTAAKRVMNQTKAKTLWQLLLEAAPPNATNKKNTNFIKAVRHLLKSKLPDPRMEVSTESPKPYKKLGEETTRDFIHAVHLERVGLIILSPYLHTLFERSGLMEQGRFLDMKARFKAVQLLEYAATGNTSKEEHYLMMHKILCGLPPEAPIDTHISLSEADTELVDGLLQAVTQQWTPMKNTSIDGFRSSFLNRTGLLDEEDQRFYLKVEQKPYDMLLDQLPWSLGTIKLSWMEKMMLVEWR